MNRYGVILKKLRELNQLTVKQAAQKIGRSSGWISQVENDRGAARLKADVFERIVTACNGESYRKQFGAWISRSRRVKINLRLLQYIFFGVKICEVEEYTTFASGKVVSIYPER